MSALLFAQAAFTIAHWLILAVVVVGIVVIVVMAWNFFQPNIPDWLRQIGLFAGKVLVVIVVVVIVIAAITFLMNQL